MARLIALLAVAAVIALLALIPTASAGNPIPGTNVQVVDLDANPKTVPFGSTTNFSWAVYNGGPATYSLNVTANVSDASFAVEPYPSAFTLVRDELREVYVNVTAPPSGSTRTVTIHVTFQTLTPVPASLDRSATLTVRTTPTAVGVLTAFAAIGAIIVIGFVASLIFERTRIPDLLILIFLGVLLGPVSIAYLGISFLPAGVLEITTPYFTAVALMVILFDGGLNLRLGQVVKKLGIVGVHTGISFLLTFVAIALVARLVLGYDWIVGLLLAAILNGTSGAVVIGIVRVLRVSEETKIILTLESVLTDVLSVVTAIALIELLRGGPGASITIVFTELGRAFLISVLLALAIGVGWIVLLRRIERQPFSYMLTIAVLFVLYALAEFLRGSGAMAAFVFGLVLGNHETFEKYLRIRVRFVIDDRIKQFHSELSFVIRTFFFVFLGVVFTLQVSGTWRVASELPILSILNGTFGLFLIGIGLIFAGIVIVRLLAARITVAFSPKPAGERRVLWSLMGRGLTAAVLASLPFTIPAFTSPGSAGDEYYRALMAPYQVQFLNIAFFIILLTVIATTLGVVSSERALGRVATPMAPAHVDRQGLAFLHETDIDNLEFYEEPPPRY